MAIAFLQEPEVVYGRAEDVSPAIRRVMANNPGPFTYRGTGTYIVGRGEVAVIDPGPADDAHLEALLAATAGETVRAILVTHSHADHSPLARPLAARTGAPIYGRADPAVGGGEASAVFRPDVEVADSAWIEGAGWRLQAMATPGHASNHVAYALEAERALFCGDLVMGWSTTVVSPPDGDMSDYLASLARVQAAEFATLWPTHGPPIRDPAPFLADYLEHRLARERQILEQLARGRSRVSQMSAGLYIGLDPRLRPAADRSVLAHLIRLVRLGTVVTEGPPGLESAYALRA